MNEPKITWKDDFFAGFTYMSLLVDGEKVYLSYTVEHKSPPTPDIYVIDHDKTRVSSHSEAKAYLLKVYQSRQSK